MSQTPWITYTYQSEEGYIGIETNIRRAALEAVEEAKYLCALKREPVTVRIRNPLSTGPDDDWIVLGVIVPSEDYLSALDNFGVGDEPMLGGKAKDNSPMISPNSPHRHKK